MNHEALSINPDTSYDPSAQEGFSDIDMQLLQAHNQLNMQVETLAVDPTLSPEEEKKKNEAIYLAVGAMSLATEGLDYDTMKHQTEVNNNQQAYVTQLMHQQISDAIRSSSETGESDIDEDEKSPRRKHRILFGAR